MSSATSTKSSSSASGGDKIYTFKNVQTKDLKVTVK